MLNEINRDIFLEKEHLFCALLYIIVIKIQRVFKNIPADKKLIVESKKQNINP